MKLTQLHESDEYLRRLERSSDPEDQIRYLRELQRLKKSEFRADPVSSQEKTLRGMPERWTPNELQSLRDLYDFVDADREYILYQIPTGDLVKIWIDGEVSRQGDQDEESMLIGQLSPKTTAFMLDWSNDKEAELEFWRDLTRIVFDY